MSRRRPLVVGAPRIAKLDAGLHTRISASPELWTNGSIRHLSLATEPQDQLIASEILSSIDGLRKWMPDGWRGAVWSKG
jgi:hypothetical protein